MTECEHIAGPETQYVPGWIVSVCTKCGKQLSRRVTDEDDPALMHGDEWPERPALIRKPLELSHFEWAVYDQMPSLVVELATELSHHGVVMRLGNSRSQARTVLAILRKLIPVFSPDPGWENPKPVGDLVSRLLESTRALNAHIEQHGIESEEEKDHPR